MRDLLATSVSALHMRITWSEETYLEQAWIYVALQLSQSYLTCKEQKHT